MIDFERCTVTTSQNDDELREVQIELQDGEVRHDVEHIEPYGFSSEPYTDKKTDAIALFTDESHELGVVINVADRRYRVKSLKTGEVVLYDDLHRKIHLKREGILIDGVDDPVTITTSNDIIANCNNCNITCKSSANINCGTSATVVAPSILLDGNVTVTGTLITGTKGGGAASFGGTVTAQGSIHSNDDVTAGSISLKNHIHTGDSGGSTSKPR